MRGLRNGRWEGGCDSSVLWKRRRKDKERKEEKKDKKRKEAWELHLSLSLSVNVCICPRYSGFSVFYAHHFCPVSSSRDPSTQHRKGGRWAGSGGRAVMSRLVRSTGKPSGVLACNAEPFTVRRNVLPQRWRVVHAAAPRTHVYIYKFRHARTRPREGRENSQITLGIFFFWGGGRRRTPESFREQFCISREKK